MWVEEMPLSYFLKDSLQLVRKVTNIRQLEGLPLIFKPLYFCAQITARLGIIPIKISE